MNSSVSNQLSCNFVSVCNYSKIDCFFLYSLTMWHSLRYYSKQHIYTHWEKKLSIIKFYSINNNVKKNYSDENHVMYRMISRSAYKSSAWFLASNIIRFTWTYKLWKNLISILLSGDLFDSNLPFRCAWVQTKYCRSPFWWCARENSMRFLWTFSMTAPTTTWNLWGE